MKESNLGLLTVFLSFGVGPLVASPPASEPSWSDGAEIAAASSYIPAERCSLSRFALHWCPTSIDAGALLNFPSISRPSGINSMTRKLL
jgi:hypothetical protein